MDTLYKQTQIQKHQTVTTYRPSTPELNTTEAIGPLKRRRQLPLGLAIL